MNPKAKKKTPKKRRRKFAYVQDWGTYSNQTLICVGMAHAEIARFMKRIKAPKHLVAEWLRDAKTLGEKWLVPSEHQAMTWYYQGRTLVWFPSWDGSWTNHDTLTHEISHLLDFVFADKKMLQETEARAYQAEFLHREIRRALFKAFP